MTGKLVLASEKLEKKIVEVKATKEEFTYITRMKKNLAKLCIGTPDSRWQILPMGHKAEVLPNTVYHDLGDEIPITLNVNNKIGVQINTSVTGWYDKLLEHITDKVHNAYVCNFSHINATNKLNGIEATKIVLDGFENTIVGYYLPKYNTFIFGNISWHAHYTEIAMAALWPQILTKLNLN